MNITQERPGVYSVYSVSAVVSSAGRNGVAALAGLSQGGTAGELYDLGTYQEAVTAFGQEDQMTELVKLLLLNGAARVLAVPVREETDYTDAFALLAQQEDVKVVVCPSQSLAVQQALRESVEEASENLRERIAVVPGGEEETAADLAQRAKNLDSQRVVLTAPGAQEGDEIQMAYVAAAVAGCICGETDPAVPLGGAVLKGLSGLSARYGESDVNTLLQAGVTVVEQSAGRGVVLRGVTTKTALSTGGDDTWRDLTTILVVDDVIPAVRQSLKSRFARAKNTSQTQGAIRSQVIVDLESKKAAEIITDYGPVTAQAVEGNPGVCLVEFSFTVAHGLNQIWLSAAITV